jgi:hypothetical protein
MRRLLSLLLCLCALACSQSEETEWVNVSQDTLIVGVDIEGALKATDSTSLGPPGLQTMWEFTISDIIADGELVKEGDKLLSFDGMQLQERLVAEENRRDSLQVTLEKRRFEISLADQDEALQLAEAEAAVRKAAIGANQSEDLAGSLIIKNAQLDLEAAQQQVDHQKILANPGFERRRRR